MASADKIQTPILELCIETLSGRWGVLKQIICTFCILADECILSTKVYMIIEISSEMW